MNFNAFEKHKSEARFLIQDYLTDVLEELIAKLIKNFENETKLAKEKTKQQKNETGDLSELIKQEVRCQIKLELSKQKRNLKKNSNMKLQVFKISR